MGRHMVPVISNPPARSAWSFALGVTGIVVGMYLVLVVIPFHIFGPRLRIVDVAMPESMIQPRVPFRIGLNVANDRWGEGSAYVVFAIEGETEIEGAVTRIPGREERNIFVEVSMDTGIRNGSLILYDAMHDNRRIDVQHGVHIVAGSLAIRLLDVNYPERIVRGETMTITLTYVVDESGPCEILPVAIVYDSGGGRPAETDGNEVMVSRGRHVLDLAVATHDLTPGAHQLTIGLYDPSEKGWIDHKISRREFRVVAR